MSALLERLTPEQVALLEAIWLEAVELQVQRDQEESSD